MHLQAVAVVSTDMAKPQELYPCKGGSTTSPFSNVWRHLTGRAGPSGWGSATTAEQVAAGWDGKGKVAIVTGASSGLGAEVARVLSGRGCEVIMAVRDVAKAQVVVDRIKAQQPGAQLTPMALSLDSLASVRSFAATFLATGKPLNILILNAGVMACPFALTQDGHELQFATNHLGHFLLTQLLLPQLEATARATSSQGRVVVLSSSMHIMTYKPRAGGPIRFDRLDSPDGYDEFPAYGQSKLCNLLFARELNARLQASGSGVVAAACHPGAIATGLGQHVHQHNFLGSLFMRLAAATVFKTIPQGAATEVYLATAPAIEPGQYYVDCNLAPSLPASQDAALGKRLWDVSEAMCAQGGQGGGSSKRGAWPDQGP